MMNKLRGMRCYLIGAMDRVEDGGIEWREFITPYLRELGVVVLNPCDKPIDIGLEDIENREIRQSLLKSKNYDKLSKDMKLLRVIDMRMVDMSDFLICYLDTDIHTCGTYEEMFWANRLKRPVLTYCKQGKDGIPLWLFGVFPHKLFFNNWGELKTYVDDINSGKDTDHLKRWTFFNYDRLTPEECGRCLT